MPNSTRCALNGIRRQSKFRIWLHAYSKSENDLSRTFQSICWTSKHTLIIYCTFNNSWWWIWRWMKINSQMWFLRWYQKLIRLQQSKLYQEPLGTRKIRFEADVDGMNVPTDLHYSLKKLIWKSKSVMSTSQLVAKNKNWKTKD